jgi:hypothetical protein
VIKVELIWGRWYPENHPGTTPWDIGHDESGSTGYGDSGNDNGGNGGSGASGPSPVTIGESTFGPGNSGSGGGSSGSSGSGSAITTANAAFATVSTTDAEGDGIYSSEDGFATAGGDDTDVLDGYNDGDSPYNRANSSLSCVNPPESYMGLPTAPCGEDFDQVLDAKIGFFDFEDSDADQSAFQGDSANEPITKRGFGDFVSSTWDKVSLFIKPDTRLTLLCFED